MRGRRTQHTCSLVGCGPKTGHLASHFECIQKFGSGPALPLSLITVASPHTSTWRRLLAEPIPAPPWVSDEPRNGSRSRTTQGSRRISHENFKQPGHIHLKKGDPWPKLAAIHRLLQFTLVAATLYIQKLRPRPSSNGALCLPTKVQQTVRTGCSNERRRYGPFDPSKHRRRHPSGLCSHIEMGSGTSARKPMKSSTTHSSYTSS